MKLVIDIEETRARVRAARANVTPGSEQELLLNWFDYAIDEIETARQEGPLRERRWKQEIALAVSSGVLANPAVTATMPAETIAKRIVTVGTALYTELEAIQVKA